MGSENPRHVRLRPGLGRLSGRSGPIHDRQRLNEPVVLNKAVCRHDEHLSLHCLSAPEKREVTGSTPVPTTGEYLIRRQNLARAIWSSRFRAHNVPTRNWNRFYFRRLADRAGSLAGSELAK